MHYLAQTVINYFRVQVQEKIPYARSRFFHPVQNVASRKRFICICLEQERLLLNHDRGHKDPWTLNSIHSRRPNVPPVPFSCMSALFIAPVIGLHGALTVQNKVAWQV